MLEVLRSVFGHAALRPGQEAVIAAILAGRDVLAVRATGFGKSLCYQLPALLLPRPTVVVSPLIALMQDQVEGLLARGIDAAAYSSALDRSERQALTDRLRHAPPRLIYLSPEALATERVRELATTLSPARVIVDEAHCISEWGHEFRPEYRNIGRFLEISGHPPVAAFTATATPQTRADIEASLRLRAPAHFVSSVDRPNLIWPVSRTGGSAIFVEEVHAAIKRALEPGGHSSGSLTPVHPAMLNFAFQAFPLTVINLIPLNAPALSRNSAESNPIPAHNGSSGGSSSRFKASLHCLQPAFRRYVSSSAPLFPGQPGPKLVSPIGYQPPMQGTGSLRKRRMGSSMLPFDTLSNRRPHCRISRHSFESCARISIGSFGVAFTRTPLNILSTPYVSTNPEERYA
jgi:hypothetical protein